MTTQCPTLSPITESMMKNGKKMSDKELLKQYLEDEKEKKKNGVNEIEIEIKIPMMGKKKGKKNGD